MTITNMSLKFKMIDSILPPPAPHMVGDGFRVHNFFPSYDRIGMEGMSPFFLLDYNSKVIIPPSDIPKGVGVHPHRGFETVTIAYHGKVAHNDSAGNSGVIGEGDVQWMTAGAGVLHKEYHEKEFSKKGGPFQMVQLWVNLPAKYKITPAKYQSIENSMMGKYLIKGGKGVVEIIAGEYKGIKGPVTTFSPMNLFNAKLPEGTVSDFDFSEKYNTGFLIIEGEVKINESKIASSDNFIFFKHEGETIAIEALKDSIILIMSGEPINEPISSYGPFLMNTEAEIQEAFDDYYSGKFGFLED
jgi:redox-sensitive bicupin YhaK (pirin superfamily)